MLDIGDILPNGSVKTSLRAVVPYTVDQIARQFGGGGHLRAAGCTIKAAMASAKRQMRRVVKDMLQGKRPNPPASAAEG